MKKTIYLFTLVFGLWSCKNQSPEKTPDKKLVDSLKSTSADNRIQAIPIKEKLQYDQSFIEGLADYNEPIKFVENYILTGKDTTYFPNDLTLNEPTTFNATKDNNKYLLTVTRINLTTLTYNFQLKDKNNKTVDSKSGKAVLNSTFFLASEIDEDSQTGDGYGSSEYWNKTNDCWFAIRIGIGKDDKGKLRAMLKYGCDDKSKQNLNLDNCPTLRTQ